MPTWRLRSRFSMHEASQPPSQPSVGGAEAVDPLTDYSKEQVLRAARPENRSAQPVERTPGKHHNTNTRPDTTMCDAGAIAGGPGASSRPTADARPTRGTRARTSATGTMAASPGCSGRRARVLVALRPHPEALLP